MWSIGLVRFFYTKIRFFEEIMWACRVATVSYSSIFHHKSTIDEIHCVAHWLIIQVQIQKIHFKFDSRGREACTLLTDFFTNRATADSAWAALKMFCHYIPFVQNVIEIFSLGSSWQYVTIGSDNGLAPGRREAIISSNADPFTDAYIYMLLQYSLVVGHITIWVSYTSGECW